MAANNDAGITAHVGINERSQRLFLHDCASVHWHFHVFIHAADVANADIASVSLANMGATLGVRQCAVHRAIQFNDPMVANLPKFGDVPLIDLLMRYGAAFRRCCTVDGQKFNR